MSETKEFTEFKENVQNIGLELVMLGDSFESKDVLTQILLKAEEAVEQSKEADIQMTEVMEGIEKALTSAILDDVGDVAKLFNAFSTSVDWLQIAIQEIENGNKLEPNSNADCIKLLNTYSSSDLTEHETEKTEISDEIETSKAQNIYQKLGILDDPELVFEFISESNSHLEVIEEKIVALEGDPKNVDLINEVFRPVHSIKGSAGYLGLKTIADLSHELETLLDKARKHTLDITPPIVDILLQGFDDIKSLFSYFSSQIDSSLYGVTGDKIKEEIDIKPIVDKIQKAIKGEIVQEEPILKNAANETSEDNAQQNKNTAKVQTKRSEEIRVKLDKLDNLVDLVGELVISQATIQQKTGSFSEDLNLNKEISNLGKITRDMQDRILSLRMVQVKQTFQRMIRLVRDLSRKQNKDIRLVLQGEDTEIDKTMVDELGDPLVHIVRNSIDHGIESSDERKAKGKSIQGTILLKASHRGGNIVIEIEDDGKGLSKQAIIDKAIERGIIDNATGMSDNEIYNLIFMPGFSTAKVVTDISGRGVGMDVVKRAIEKLRGKVEIESTPDKGSKISIALPLTLAIIDGMVVKTGNQKYVIPLISIVESIRPVDGQIKTVQGKGEMVNVRGELLPLVRLHELFDITEAKTTPEDALVMVIECRTKKYCMLVDDLLGQQQIVVKSLGEKLKNVVGISAATILGDGKVGLILDLESIMSLAFSY